MQRRTGTQRGAVAMIAAMGIVVLVLLAIGGITLGRAVIIRRDAQRAADAAVLAALQMIRDVGLPFDDAKRAAAEAVAQVNSNQPLTFVWQETQDQDSYDIEVTVTGTLTGPASFVPGGSQAMVAVAGASVAQSSFDTVDPKRAKVVFVLDYSGSMDGTFEFERSQRLIDVLESNMANLLGLGLPVEIGAVLFSDDVLATVPVALDSAAQIISAMGRYDADGFTNTPEALARAADILRASPDTGRYIIFVSDGQPAPDTNSRMATSQEIASLARNDNIRIYTLEIRTGFNQILDQFMTAIAGGPTNPGDENDHYVAQGADDLRNTFGTILSSIVCTVGPLEPPPSRPNQLRVYLASGGIERPVPAIPEAEQAGENPLGLYADQERYLYQPDENQVKLTNEACNAVMRRGERVAIRYDRAALVQ
jgi:Mg-chelatase subunit ChlD